MKAEDKFVKGFEWLVEAFFWLKFAASPILTSLVVGGLISASIDGNLGYIIWGIVILTGIIGGIALAEYARKQPGGASTYDSRVMATPELDNLPQENVAKKSNTTSTVRDSGSSPE